MTNVSVLFNEPKLLKFAANFESALFKFQGFSALQRAEIAEIGLANVGGSAKVAVSVLFNEPKLLK